MVDISVFDRLMSEEADPALFSAFSVKALYNDSTVVDAILDHDVERLNSYGESIRNLHEITVMNKQVGRLKKGDTVEFSGLVYTITDIVTSDANITIGEANRESG